MEDRTIRQWTHTTVSQVTACQRPASEFAQGGQVMQVQPEANNKGVGASLKNAAYASHTRKKIGVPLIWGIKLQ